jgi:hypothetical protein
MCFPPLKQNQGVELRYWMEALNNNRSVSAGPDAPHMIVSALERGRDNHKREETTHETLFLALAAALVIAVPLGLSEIRTADAQQVTQLRWATSAVGSAGHRAKVALMAMLNREMPDYSITVLPTPARLPPCAAMPPTSSTATTAPTSPSANWRATPAGSAASAPRCSANPCSPSGPTPWKWAWVCGPPTGATIPAGAIWPAGPCSRARRPGTCVPSWSVPCRRWKSATTTWNWTWAWPPPRWPSATLTPSSSTAPARQARPPGSTRP